MSGRRGISPKGNNRRIIKLRVAESAHVGTRVYYRVNFTGFTNTLLRALIKDVSARNNCAIRIRKRNASSCKLPSNSPMGLAQ